jgi:hypothetical protein
MLLLLLKDLGPNSPCKTPILTNATLYIQSVQVFFGRATQGS